MTTSDNTPQNWPDLAVALYDRLTGRDAEITYDFDNMRIRVPSGLGDNARQAEWKLDGALRIRCRDGASVPK